MFVGQYEHAIDEKNRLAIPSKFRRDLPGGAIITKGLDGCLFVFSKGKWKEMAQSIGQLPLAKKSARAYARLILASAADADFDKQGRVILPGHLKNYAGISRGVVVAGLYDRVEVWSTKKWREEVSGIDRDAGEIIEELSELGV